MVKFILLTTQRSGATFLCTSLNSHPQIECHHEAIFSQINKIPFENLKFKPFLFDRPSSAYYKYRSASWGRKLAHWSLIPRKQLIYDFLDDLYARPAKATAVGYKISYNHADKYPTAMAWLQQNEIKIIHLVRSNLLKTYLSKKTAWKRRLHHATTPSIAPVKVRVPIRRLRRDLKRRTKVIEKYRAMFGGSPYLELSYESVVAQPEREIRRILQFLDIDQYVPLTTNLVKINPDTLTELIENYDEVEHAFQGTIFEKYLS
jgi:hypothetical protein